MNCAELESLLADYLDGSLASAERTSLEVHAASCAGCAEFMRDVTGGMEFLKRAEEVTPPPELITRIAYHAPVGRTRHPFDRQGLLGTFAARWLQPVLQPRFAMGMAMTILSFAMLERCTGVQVQHIQAADLSPVRIWDGVEDKAIRLKDRAVKYYENIRFVYEVETRLRELEERQTAAQEDSSRRRRVARESTPQSGKTNGGVNAPDQGDKKTK
jgi:hypothetical protein